MRPAPNIEGKRFGTLVATWPVGFGRSQHSLWLCVCDCGALSTKYATNLTSERVTVCSVGGHRLNKTHGMTNTPEHIVWRGMLERCSNPNHISYERYGGRGITVCDRWKEFRNFYEDMGPRPAGTSIDRVDNSGPYEPNNCRWSTPAEQSLNKRKRKSPRTPKYPLGSVFGGWTLVSVEENRRWLLRCECGIEKLAHSSNVVTNRVACCACKTGLGIWGYIAKIEMLSRKTSGRASVILADLAHTMRLAAEQLKEHLE